MVFSAKESITKTMLAKDRMKFLLNKNDSEVTVVPNYSNDKFYKTEQNLSKELSLNPLDDKVCMLILNL